MLVIDDRDETLRASFSCHRPSGLRWRLHEARQGPSQQSMGSASSSSSLLALLLDSNAHLLASPGVAAESQLLGLGFIGPHEFPLFLVVLSLFLESILHFFFLLMHGSLFLVQLDEVEFLLVFCLGGKPSGCQSPLVFDGLLSLDEEVEVVIVQVVHFLTDANEAKRDQEFISPSQTQNLVLDGVVGGLDASILLFEGLLDDAESRMRYLEVSLQRMLSPSLKAWGSLSFSILARTTSTLS